MDAAPTSTSTTASRGLAQAALSSTAQSPHCGKTTVVGHVCVVGDVDEPAIAAEAGFGPEHLLSVSRLFTHPNGRGQQLGARLLAAVQAYAAAERAHLMLDVVDDDGTAIHLYDRLQGKRVDRRLSDWTTPNGRRYDTVYFLAPDRPTKAV